MRRKSPNDILQALIEAKRAAMEFDAGLNILLDALDYVSDQCWPCGEPHSTDESFKRILDLTQ